MNRKTWLVIAIVYVMSIGIVALAEQAQKGPGKYMADYQTSAEFFTMMEGMTQGNSPHGKVQIWYSSNIKDLIKQPRFMAPEGTVSIKPFDNDGNMGVDGIAVMIKKQAGYDAEHGDWYYEMRMADGKIMEKMGMPMTGKIKMCIGCHAAAANTDYLAGVNMR